MITTILSILGQPSRHQFKYLRPRFNHRDPKVSAILLKGAKPGDLPIQQPIKFEMVVNITTAKAIGVTFTETFMLRVDRVIE